jgi:anti-sigma regulatory factor (Ser/Thr protein kinase)
MRTGAAAGHRGYFHETAFYASDDELMDIVVPFLRDGVAAGEPTIVAFGDHNAAVTRTALGDATGVTFMPGDHYARPAATIRAYRSMFAAYIRDGATQIRAVGDVPHPGTGVSWEAWGRYEGVINFAYDDFPLWGLCPYDTRTTPAAVLEDVRRTHPNIALRDGSHVRNPDFEDPEDYLRSLPAPEPDTIESTAPLMEFHDAAPIAARTAARDVARASGLDGERTSSFVLSVSEVVANASLHGTPPSVLRFWSEPGRAVATVRDAGTGPPHTGVGLVRDPKGGGVGLWIAEQMCSEVSFRREPDGFTVRVVMEERG